MKKGVQRVYILSKESFSSKCVNELNLLLEKGWIVEQMCPMTSSGGDSSNFEPCCAVLMYRPPEDDE